MQIRCLVSLLLISASPVVGQATAPVPDSADVVSPRGAFVRSLVVPGWGQAVVGSPARGAAYFALESVSLWMALRSNRRLDDARAQQRLLRAAGQIAADQETGLVGAREQQREDWITLSMFWLFFAGADAYVAAYLKDFGEHVGVRPGGAGTLRLEATLPMPQRR